MLSSGASASKKPEKSEIQKKREEAQAKLALESASKSHVQKVQMKQRSNISREPRSKEEITSDLERVSKTIDTINVGKAEAARGYKSKNVDYAAENGVNLEMYINKKKDLDLELSMLKIAKKRESLSARMASLLSKGAPKG